MCSELGRGLGWAWLTVPSARRMRSTLFSPRRRDHDVTRRRRPRWRRGRAAGAEAAPGPGSTPGARSGTRNGIRARGWSGNRAGHDPCHRHRALRPRRSPWPGCPGGGPGRRRRRWNRSHGGGGQEGQEGETGTLPVIPDPSRGRSELSREIPPRPLPKPPTPNLPPPLRALNSSFIDRNINYGAINL